MSTNKIYHKEPEDSAVFYAVIIAFSVVGLFVWNIF
ncbi:hypothetical protein Nit79A3_1711 [Nitrosomonas sp. Is79A3]